jgi:hypothetical protein
MDLFDCRCSTLLPRDQLFFLVTSPRGLKIKAHSLGCDRDSTRPAVQQGLENAPLALRKKVRPFFVPSGFHQGRSDSSSTDRSSACGSQVSLHPKKRIITFEARPVESSQVSRGVLFPIDLVTHSENNRKMSNRSPIEEYAEKARRFALQNRRRVPFGGGGRGGGNPFGLAAIAFLGIGGAVLLQNSLFNVDGGHRAIKYTRISGVSKEIYGEGRAARSDF